MIIDNKGKILGKINIVDLLVMLLSILIIFIAIKLILFRQEYFIYEDLGVTVYFAGIAPENIKELLDMNASNAYLDEISYLEIPKNQTFDCHNSEKEIILHNPYDIQLYIKGGGYSCNALLSFKLHTRIIEGGHYYNNYYINEGNMITINLGDMLFNRGDILEVYKIEQK